MCIITPNSPLVPLALLDLDSMISMLEAVQHIVPRRWLRKSLEWLIDLRSRASRKVDAHRRVDEQQDTSPESTLDDTTDHLMLIGWRTRLVDRGGSTASASVARPPSSQAGPSGHSNLLSVPTQTSDFLNPQLSVDPFGSDFASILPTTSTPDFLQELLGGPTGFPFEMSNQTVGKYLFAVTDIVRTSTIYSTTPPATCEGTLHQMPRSHACSAS
jgi:hypothetical protein